jgi:branched-chain amino acid aminotransferase
VIVRPHFVWLDGHLLAALEPHVSVFDRGFQLGDGLFETLRARRGVPIEWTEHLERLREGAAVLRIRVPDARTLRAGLAELLDHEGLSGPGDDRFPAGDAAVRITITRGVMDGRGTLPEGWREHASTVAIQAWSSTPPSAEALERGVHAVTSTVRRDPASPLAGIKTISRADHVLARLQADAAGADDALFLTLDGRVSEATSANVAALIDGRLVTPPIGAAILVGTTRTWLLAQAALGRLGLKAIERDLRPADLLAADEAFLTSSVAGIVPLTALDGRPIGSGWPGELTRRLRAEREAWIDRESLAGG